MKNLLRYFLLLVTAGMIFTSCQKELSAETGTSKGALVKDAGGNCSPATPNGTFKKDTALTNNNYVDIQVNITEIGVYFITTDTVNGYSFKGTGVTVLTGANTIRLTGVGKPLVVGTDNFKVRFDGSVCDFTINVLDATGGGGGGTAATFNFVSAGGVCTSTLNGIFTQGVNTVGNSVTVNITVLTPGTYTLATLEVNGVTFSNTGFLNIGDNSVILNATGIPQNAGPLFPFPLVSGASVCGFNVPVLPGAGGGGGAITDSISCTVNGTFKSFVDMPNILLDSTTFPAIKALIITGDSSNSIEAFQFLVGNPTGNIPAATYTVNQGPAILVGGQYTDGNNVDFISSTATVATNPTPAFTVTITSITGGALGVTGTRVKGTFAGALKEDGGTAVKTITGGYFDLTF